MLNGLIERYPQLESCLQDIDSAAELIINTYKNGGKVLVCGNGGSAADSEHIVGELMKGFMLKRKVEDERIPETETFKVQEYHLPVYHYLCAMTEKVFFDK